MRVASISGSRGGEMTDHAAEAAASELKAQAFGLLQSHAMEQAAEVLQRAAELDPGDAPTWQLLGLLWSEVGAPDRAYEAATRYVGLEPDRAQAYLNRGAIGLDLGRFDDAIADHRRAARLQRTSDTLVWLANAYGRAGRFDEAFATYDEALETDPDNPVAHYERALAHRGRRHFAEAIADVDRALALDPEYEAAWSLRESLIVEECQPAGDSEPGNPV
jgi:pentatricopeptide repeat protein